MSADLYFTSVSSSSFFFFAAWSPRSLNGTERKSATWSEVSVIYKRMSEIWDTPSPYKSGAQNPPFWADFSTWYQLYRPIFSERNRYRQSVKCVDNYKGSPTSSQNVINFGLQTASNSTCIFTHLCKFRIPLHCQASQTEISKRNSTTLCQTVNSRPL